MRITFIYFFMLLISVSVSVSNISSNPNNATIRPPILNIGAIFAFNSTIGKVAKIAIEAALADINADHSLLPGSQLRVRMQDSNCSAFVGIVKALQFMESDTIAIIGPQCSTVAHVVSQVSTELQVPLISFGATDPTLSSFEYPFFVRTTQSDVFQMEAIADLLNFHQFKKVIAIYIDDDYGRNGLSSLSDKLNDRRCKISYKAPLAPKADRNDISKLLVKVNTMESRVFVLLANPTIGRDILEIAHYLDMMGSGYVWVATDWLTSLLDTYFPLDSDTMSTMQGFLALRQHTVVTSKLKKAFVSRWNELNKKENFHLNVYGLYAYDTMWVVARAIHKFLENGGKISFSRDVRLRKQNGSILELDAMSLFDEGGTLLKAIRSVNFTGVTGRVEFDLHGNLLRPAYDIVNVIGSGVRTIGYWTNYTGLSSTTPEEIYTKPANRSKQSLLSVVWPGQTVVKPRGWVFPNNGVELKIGVPRRVSFTAFVSMSPSTGAVTGFCIDVFTAAVSLLPYAVPFRFIPFGNGSQNPDYNALESMVSSNSFDAAVGDIVITTNRTKNVDFTQPFIESGLVIVAPIKEDRSNAWAFLQPFSLEMWCITGLFFIVVGVVIWILEHRSNDEFRGPPSKQFVTVFWFSFSTLFFSHRENTVSTLGRILLIIWLFVVLIIQSSYTASLTSILTVRLLSSPVKGLDELIASGLPIGFQVGSFAENYMVEQLHIARSRLKPLGSPEQYAAALKLGPDNGGVVAVIDERAYVELFLSTHCEFTIVGSEFTRTGWGFAFPRDSPLAIDMSTAILSLSENGDLQRIRDKWLRTTACKAERDEIDSDQVQLSSFWGLFLICGLACFLSLLVYFVLMVCKFSRHVPQTSPELASEGTSSSKSMRSLHSFLSFVDDKEEDRKAKAKRKRMEKSNQGSVVDNENEMT